MKIRNTGDGLFYAITISEATARDIRAIRKSGRFQFDWQKPTGVTTLKLVLKDTDRILGLMSVTDRVGDLAMEINMLESAKENVGEQKEYDGVAGCLIAYACREAFNRGYDGFICLKPKTALEQHYSRIYGMTFMGQYMVAEGVQSYRLIRQYLEN